MREPLKTGTVLDGLCEIPRALVFVDDGGTPGKPLPTLAGDFHLMVGVVIPSEKYRALSNEMQATLLALRPDLHLREFHAAEIVNKGPKHSPWRQCSEVERRSAILFLGEILSRVADCIAYVYASGEQMDERLVRVAKERGVPRVSCKVAVEKVFLKLVVTHVQRTAEQVAIVADSREPRNQDIKIMEFTRRHEGLYQNSVIYADSMAVCGLQLADFAAYAINRLFHIRERAKNGRIGPFDELLLDAASRVQKKMVNLLSDGKCSQARE
jgi:hypothetical protein